MNLELVYRATGDVEADDPVTGRHYVAAVKGDVLTAAELKELGIDGAPRRLRTTEGVTSRQNRE